MAGSYAETTFIGSDGAEHVIRVALENGELVTYVDGVRQENKDRSI